MKSIVCTILALLLGLCLSATACADDATPVQDWNEGFFNPFLSLANDPWIIRGDGWYYYCYSWTGMHIARSRTLTGFDGSGLIRDNVKSLNPGYDQTELWAPELHHYQDHWYVFYAADFNNDNTRHRMYVMKSATDDPMGDWEGPVKLNLPEDQWAIDGTFFEFRDGRIFIIWSGWRDNAQGTSLWKQYLYITQLETGDPTKVIGTERIMISKPQYYWESSVLPQNEGPTIWISPAGTYYCFYAGNYSGSDKYVIAALRLNGDPMDADAWEKLPQPILESNPEAGIYSPGHASIVKSPDGTEDWIIYHTAKYPGAGWTRNGRAQRLLWVNDMPLVEGGLAGNDAVQPMPSGEVTDRIILYAADGKLDGEAALTENGNVMLPKSKGSVTFHVQSDRKIPCVLYVRYSAASLRDTSFVRAKVNGSTFGVAAVPSGNENQLIISCIAIQLQEGMNEIIVSGNCPLVVNSIIIDRNPY